MDNDTNKTADLSDSCCGGTAPAGVNACCMEDADLKAAGESGCGCGTDKEVEKIQSETCC